MRDSMTPDTVPLRWKLGACAAIILLAVVVAALLTIPFSCLLNDWPQPVCRMVQSIIPQAEKGE